MKIVIFTAILALTLGTGAANSQPPYQPPAHNYYQNNWMGGN